MDSNSLCVPGIPAKRLQSISDLLNDDPDKKIRVSAHAHTIGSVCRGIEIELSKSIPFPTELFLLEGLSVLTCCYSFGRLVKGTKYYVERGLYNLCQDSAPRLREMFTLDSELGKKLGSSTPTPAISICRLSSNKWGLVVRSHDQDLTVRTLSKLRGVNTADAGAIINEHLQEAALENADIANAVAKELGIDKLSEESMFCESTVIDNKIYLGCGILLRGTRALVPTLSGTVDIALEPQGATTMQVQGTVGALELPDEETDSIFISSARQGMYDQHMIQHLTVGGEPETNLLLIVGVASKFSYDGLMASFLSNNRADGYHTLAYFRSLSAALLACDLLHTSDIAESVKSKIKDGSTECSPKTVPSQGTLLALTRMFNEKLEID